VIPITARQKRAKIHEFDAVQKLSGNLFSILNDHPKMPANFLLTLYLMYLSRISVLTRAKKYHPEPNQLSFKPSCFALLMQGKLYLVVSGHAHIIPAVRLQQTLWPASVHDQIPTKCRHALNCSFLRSSDFICTARRILKFS